MIILGLDPSLRGFGWVLLDADGISIVEKGLLSTDADMIFIDRYLYLREELRKLVKKWGAYADERGESFGIGIESPIFNDLYSEGMYGLFLYCNEVFKTEGKDVVFLSPHQVKAQAHEHLGRPKGWKMQKNDMVDAAKSSAGATHGAGGTKMNHHQADAYWVGRGAWKFWRVIEEVDGGKELEEAIKVVGLSVVDEKQFTDVDLYLKGVKAGSVKRKGILYKESDRWFRWSKKI